MTQYCYVNGKISPTEKSSFPIMDISILRGYAVFDVLRTYNGEPFLWDLHWKRLLRSAKSLNIVVPMSSAEALTITRKLHKKNGLTESNIRILVSGGISPDGFATGKVASIAILVTPFVELPSLIFNKGAKLMLHEHLREEYPSKTTNYLTAVKMRPIVIKKGALEILYHHDGKILECATSNFFIVKKNTIITPKDGILVGITRNLVMQLAKKHYTVIERDIAISELKTCDEAFLTATNKDIVPVTTIETFKVADGKVGSVTRHLMKIFSEQIGH